MKTVIEENKLIQTSQSDQDVTNREIIAEKNHEYFCWVNSYGAVSAILPNGEKLGLRPAEFDVVEWHEKG